MAVLSYILVSCFIITLLALIGFFSLLMARKWLENILVILVAFAAGALLGGAFFHLIPEALELGGPVFSMILIGIVVFFAIEIFLFAYHCYAGHKSHKHKHKTKRVRPVGILNLIGDGVHNITDGIIIASSFLVSIPLGIVTSIAVALHEIPQEVGDFGILVYSGYKRKRALLLNYIAALTIFIGALGFYFFTTRIEGLVVYALPFAAGGFLYIALTDLLGELREEEKLGRHLIQFLVFLLGILLLWTVRFIA